MSAREILTSLRRRIFGDSARTFGIMSVVFLVSLAIAPAKNYFSEWRKIGLTHSTAWCPR